MHASHSCSQTHQLTRVTAEQLRQAAAKCQGAALQGRGTFAVHCQEQSPPCPHPSPRRVQGPSLDTIPHNANPLHAIHVAPKANRVERPSLHNTPRYPQHATSCKAPSCPPYPQHVQPFTTHHVSPCDELRTCTSPPEAHRVRKPCLQTSHTFKSPPYPHRVRGAALEGVGDEHDAQKYRLPAVAVQQLRSGGWGGMQGGARRGRNEAMGRDAPQHGMCACSVLQTANCKLQPKSREFNVQIHDCT